MPDVTLTLTAEERDLLEELVLDFFDVGSWADEDKPDETLAIIRSLWKKLGRTEHLGY